MKIISKFQDYYDCGVAYGIDEKLYFERKTTKEKEHKKEHKGSLSWLDKKEITSFEQNGAVYFCGKKYPFKLVATSKTGEPIKRYLATLDNFDYKYYYTKEQYLEDNPNPDENKYKHWFNRISLDEYFIIEDVQDDEFIRRGVPYFIDETNLPVLKDYQFAKIIDPMTAFQEISMYLGVLNNKEQKCEIGEEHRIKGHGFDKKSFRKR